MYVRMAIKGLDDTLHNAHDDLNLHILCIFEGSFSLDAANIRSKPVHPFLF